MKAVLDREEVQGQDLSVAHRASGPMGEEPSVQDYRQEFERLKEISCDVHSGVAVP